MARRSLPLLSLAIRGLVASGILWGFGAPAVCAELLVDTLDDAADARPGDGLCATERGSCTLRAALQEASARQGRDAIVLPAGRFRLSGEAPLAVRGALSLRGAGDASVLDAAGGAGLLQVASGARLELSRLQLVGASAAALRCGEGAECHLERVRIAGCGGEVALDCRGALACRLREVEVVENPAELAIACGPCELEGVRVADNRGAGVVAAEAALSLVDSRIAGNGAAGLSWRDRPVTVRRSAIEDNAGVGLLGARESRELELRESLVRGNRGGGIETGGRVQVWRSAIVDNQRAEGCGGGMRLEGGSSSGSRLIASTVSGNRAPEGGGVCVLFLGGRLNPFLSILASTVTANRAERGGGVRVVGRLQRVGPPGPAVLLEESVVAGNLAEASPDCLAPKLHRTGARSAFSGGWNWIGDASGCGLEPAGGDVLGRASEPRDPGLAPLADRGGPTPSHAVMPDSPLRDRVPPPACARSPILEPGYAQHRIEIGPDVRFERTGLLEARDTRWLSFSGWFEFARPIGRRETLLSAGEGERPGQGFLSIGREPGGQLGVELRDGDGGLVLHAISHQVIPSGSLHSLVLGYNAGIRKLDGFLDDEELEFDVRRQSSQPIPWASRSAATWRLFAGADGSDAFVGRVADVWVDDDFLSMDSGTERYAFYDLNNRPLDLGVDGREATKTGARPPLLYLGHGMRASDWAAGRNLGRGGPFRVSGRPADVPPSREERPAVLDQRGIPRPQGEGCDVGAFERRGDEG